MNCPNCGAGIKDNQKFCKHCGIKLEQQFLEKQENYGNFSQDPSSKYLVYAFGFFLVIFVVLSVWLHEKNNTTNTNINNSNNSVVDEIKLKAKNCEDSEIKDMVLNIYKKNDYYYKYIDSSSIDSIILQSPVATDYNGSIDKYSCKGVVVISGSRGLKPTNYEYNNDFYSLIKTYRSTDDNVPLLRKAIEIKCPVTYSSQISEGNSTVYSSYCGKISTWSSETEPTIIWDGNEEYIEQPGERVRIQKERKEQEKLQEQQRQAELKRKEEELRKQQQSEQKRKEEQEQYNNSPEGRYRNAQEDLF